MNDLDHLFQQTKDVHLNDFEKAAIKNRLIIFMDQQPTGTPGLLHWLWEQWNALMPLPLVKALPVFLIIALVFSGGVSLAAENALPGQPLYSIKLNVNERVLAAAALSAKEKADVHARLAERRLEEAETLAAQGKLNTEIQAALSARFSGEAEQAKEAITAVKLEDRLDIAADLSSQLEITLKAHEKILMALSAGDDGKAPANVEPLLSSVAVKAKEASEKRIDIEQRVSTQTEKKVKAAAEGKHGTASQKISDVENLVATKKDALGIEATAEAQARLDRAQQIIDDAETQLHAEAFADAFTLSQKADRAAEETKLLMKAKTNLNIRVKTQSEDLDHSSTKPDERKRRGKRNAADTTTATTTNAGAESTAETIQGSTEAQTTAGVGL